MASHPPLLAPLLASRGPHKPPCWGCSMEPHLSEGSRVRASAHSVLSVLRSLARYCFIPCRLGFLIV